MLLVVLYLIAGFWAAHVVYYEDKIVIFSSPGKLFANKLMLGFGLG